MSVRDGSTKEKFLREDLRDALRWLFEGAIAWEAAKKRPERAGHHQVVLGMYVSLVQARALYEFFYGHGQGDDARASHFAPAWKPLETEPYRKYMAGGKPANKRVFHLVYNRAAHAGGSGHEGPDHLKNQVLEFAKDLRTLTEEFARNAGPAFRDSAQGAFREALKEANRAADHYGIANPL
jgi:hypothetical protein